MLIAAALSAVAAIPALLSRGWISSLTFALLGLIAFAFSKVFELLATLLDRDSRSNPGSPAVALPGRSPDAIP